MGKYRGNKFEMAAKDIAEQMRWIAIAAVREGVKAGLQAAIEKTHHDSSNAAYQWYVGFSIPEGTSVHPARTAAGRGPHDYRKGVNGAPLRHTYAPSPVGHRRANGKFRSAVHAAVITREWEESISQIKGSYAPRNPYFHNSVNNNENYAINASIEAGGTAALTATKTAFEGYMQNNKSRRKVGRAKR